MNNLPIRYITGQSLAGHRKTDATFFHRGTQVTTMGYVGRWSYLAGWQRAAWRLGTPVGALGLISIHCAYPTPTNLALGTAGAITAHRLTRRARRRWVNRRFRRMYLRPLASVIGGPLGRPDWLDPERWLTISPDLAGLAPRLARPMSPAEATVRDWYGEHMEPVVRWLPDRVMRGYWGAREAVEPAAKLVRWFRAPEDSDAGPRIEIRAAQGVFITKEIRERVAQAVHVKLGLGDLVETWDQVGPQATGTYVVKRRPRSVVTYEDALPYMLECADHELFAGFAAGDKPVILSLEDDSPHIACSAGSGGGKSVLAKLLGVQVLSKGGRVIILDRKGSHRWARGLPGVLYCSRPADMHDALIGAAHEANRRNDEAMEHEEGWVPGERVFIIFEEMNATVAQLKTYWDGIREPGQPKASPAIAAFRELMYMGRSAYHHLFGVAQMLTANTTGGPEARENFGIRCLARYTANNWKMLVPEVAMPRKSKIRGRWQIVSAGEAMETQVAYLTDPEVALYLSQCLDTCPDQQIRDVTPEVVTRGITLEYAASNGVVSIRYPTLRAHRIRYPDAFPKPIGGNVNSGYLYEPADLKAWEASREGANK